MHNGYILLYNLFYFMCMNVCLHVGMCTLSAPGALRSQKRALDPRNQGQRLLETTMWYKLVPLQEQQVPLTIGTISPAPHTASIRLNIFSQTFAVYL